WFQCVQLAHMTKCFRCFHWRPLHCDGTDTLHECIGVACLRCFGGGTTGKLIRPLVFLAKKKKLSREKYTPHRTLEAWATEMIGFPSGGGCFVVFCPVALSAMV